MADNIFMVYVVNGEAPKARHETLEVATTEAARLAHKTGQPAFVLRAVRRVTPDFRVKTEEL